MWRLLSREPILALVMFGVCGALLGVFREQSIADKLGLSMGSNAYFTALTMMMIIPNLIVAAAAGAIAPRHARALREHGPAQAKAEIGKVLGSCTAAAIGSVLLALVLAGLGYPILAARMDPQNLSVTAHLMGLLLLALPATAMAGAGIEALNVQGKFALGSASGLLGPVATIVFLYLPPLASAPVMAATGLVLGLNAQALLVGWGLRTQGLSSFRMPEKSERGVIGLALFRLGINSFLVNLPNLIALGLIAATGSNAMASYNFATKLTVGVTALTCTVFVTLLGPLLAARAAGVPYSRRRLKTYLVMALGTVAGASLFLTAFSPEVIRLFFVRGAFLEASVAEVARLQVMAAFFLPTSLLFTLSFRAVLAYHDTVFTEVVCMARSALALLLLWPLNAYLGLGGVLLALSVPQGLAGAVLFWRYRGLHRGTRQQRLACSHPAVANQPAIV